jgi:hypothetical protein
VVSHTRLVTDTAETALRCCGVPKHAAMNVIKKISTHTLDYNVKLRNARRKAEQQLNAPVADPE